MKSKNDPRHNARKLALSSIFCWLFSEPNPEECLELSKNLLDTANAQLDLTADIVNGVRENRSLIDNIISENAPEWPLDKIAKIDLVILRIAIFELRFGKEMSEKIVIDEAVELAKEFGSETSPKFVNGVLGSVVTSKDLKDEL